jgi:hypothetical protein
VKAKYGQKAPIDISPVEALVTHDFLVVDTVILLDGRPRFRCHR